MKQPPVIVIQLFHIKGPAPLHGKEQEFSEPSIFIGRHPSCHLRFPVELTHISRKHAEIVREGNQFKLIDHSANGTFVNGKKVKEIYLKDGDVLTFAEGGPQVSFLTQMKEGGAPEVVKEVRIQPPKVETPIQPQRPVEERPPSVLPKRDEALEVSVQPVKAPLIIQYGPTIRSFKQLPITIGKSPKCEYPLDHPALSDQHAQIFFGQDQYWVKDLTGQKLVRINRQPVGFQASLKPNDELALSPQGPLFRFFGEGRLGEIEEAPEEKPIESSEKTGAVAEEKSISSKFKKIFKS
ncbi:MAG: FHA domain-containing protein [Thermodesulfobacteriota bacterium]|nr:FHA domain-containing protein [Thermodesulfobacteriota bacterium]